MSLLQHAHFHSSPRPKTRLEGSSARASESNATFDYAGESEASRQALFEKQVEKMLEEDQKASSDYGFKEFMRNLNKNFVSWLMLAGVVLFAAVHFKIMVGFCSPAFFGPVFFLQLTKCSFLGAFCRAQSRILLVS